MCRWSVLIRELILIREWEGRRNSEDEGRRRLMYDRPGVDGDHTLIVGLRATFGRLNTRVCGSHRMRGSQSINSSNPKGP